MGNAEGDDGNAIRFKCTQKLRMERIMRDKNKTSVAGASESPYLKGRRRSFQAEAHGKDPSSIT